MRERISAARPRDVGVAPVTPRSLCKNDAATASSVSLPRLTRAFMVIIASREMRPSRRRSAATAGSGRDARYSSSAWYRGKYPRLSSSTRSP